MSARRNAILALYASVTLLDLVRAVIHTIFYKSGLDNISGLSTGDELCDNRLAAIMIAYGGANLESFLLRAFVLYAYARDNSRGRDLVRASSVASALWFPVTRIVSSVGKIDVGDADVPGKYAMLVRSIVSVSTLLLTYA